MFWAEGFWVDGFWVDGFWVDTEEPPPAESPPTDLSVSEAGGTATLSWTDSVSDNTGYSIERSDDGGAYVEVGTAGADAETFDDVDTFLEGVVYRYRLVVTGGALDGEFSNTTYFRNGASQSACNTIRRSRRSLFIV